jgi:hypothetical protein
MCVKEMRLWARPGATLANQIVTCDCGESRTLANITSGTTLTEDLDGRGVRYLCTGKRPWVGDEAGEPCGARLRGSLRNASNLYFSQVKSSIYLPRDLPPVSEDLLSVLETPSISTLARLARELGATIAGALTPAKLRDLEPALLHRFSDDQISAGVSIAYEQKLNPTRTEPEIIEDIETSFRRDEHEVLLQPRDDTSLRIKPIDTSLYEAPVAEYFSKVLLVERLTETRAFIGFTRVFADSSFTLEQQKAMLWRKPSGNIMRWLPAYTVFGEGLLLELREDLLRNWLQEAGSELEDRIRPLADRQRKVQLARHLKTRAITPRFLLLHTLSHVLMNRLTYECGYGSAALRERLYFSENERAPMAGILIYTASGDSEGTMGGLVRMGKPGFLEPVVRRALEAARWCSADPVCIEMGSRGGQGPDSLNLAACHNCALVPETACEEFNRLLDRAVLIGNLENPRLGFFDRHLQQR